MYLKDSEQSVNDRIKVGRGCSLWEVELSTEELHPQQREDEDEEEEEEQEGHDGGQRVHQRDHKIPQSRPVSKHWISIIMSYFFIQ